ncbi:MAG: hypothetical protein R3211_00475 [Balneolaceae bacterium]|nr:hypothetical protein [Balneolaceae bacterium]
MSERLTYGALLGILLTALSCTSPRWIVEERNALDETDYRQVSSTLFLEQSGAVSFDQPVLHLQLLSKNTYRYAEKVRMQRYMQDYRLKPGYMALSLTASAIAFYAGNASSIINNPSTIGRFSLNAAGTILAISSLLNLEPVGPPKPTGEEQLLRQTGSRTVIDTLQVNDPINRSPYIEIYYNNLVLADSVDETLGDGLIEIDLASRLQPLNLTGEKTGTVRVEVSFADSLYSYTFPVQQVLRPFAKVTSPVTELRNAPEATEDNILVELVEGSQLQIVETVDDQWYKVLYGISENYLFQDDTKVVWQPAGFSQEQTVVAVPSIPFGNIDVENNIPVIADANPGGVGLIVTNENYTGKLTRNKYAHRDGRLMRTYLTDAFGFDRSRIYSLQDLTSSSRLDKTLNSIEADGDSISHLVVFISGYGRVTEADSDYQLSLLPAEGKQGDGGPPQELALSPLFQTLAEMPAEQLILITDIDFTADSLSNQVIAEMDSYLPPLQELASIITSRNERSALFFGSGLDQGNHIYMGEGMEDKKHHIFPYFFARAIQQRHLSMEALIDFLQGNVSYTARKLHDAPQDPQFYGNRRMELIEQP